MPKTKIKTIEKVINKRTTCDMCVYWKRSDEVEENRSIGPCYLHQPQVLNVQRVDKTVDNQMVIVPHWMNMRPQCMAKAIACMNFEPIKD